MTPDEKAELRKVAEAATVQRRHREAAYRFTTGLTAVPVYREPFRTLVNSWLADGADGGPPMFETESRVARLLAENERESLVLLLALLDENARLAAEVERLTKWIPCSKRMPEPGEQILFIALGDVSCGYFRRPKPGGTHFTHRWFDRLDIDALGEPAHYTNEQVTHWMPLPEPPK